MNIFISHKKNKMKRMQPMTDAIANTSTQAQQAARSILALLPNETFRRDGDYYTALNATARIIQGVIDTRDQRPAEPNAKRQGEK